jgi:hypothetical protein
MQTDEEKKYRAMPAPAAASTICALIRTLLRRTSVSAEWMNPMPPMSAASW